MEAQDTEEEPIDDGPATEPESPKRYGVPVSESRGQTILHPDRDQLLEVAADIRDDGFEMCLDVTAVDYLDHPGRELPVGIEPGRYELVVSLISHRRRERLRLRIQVPGDDPAVASLFDIYPGTEAPEREIYDMFGITFDGHPDMTRILMPEDWTGHPLRKDYAVGAIPVQFRDAPGPR